MCFKTQNAANGPQPSHTSSSSPRRHARVGLAENFATLGALTSSRAPPWSSMSMSKFFWIISMGSSASMNVANVCRHSEKTLSSTHQRLACHAGVELSQQCNPCTSKASEKLLRSFSGKAHCPDSRHNDSLVGLKFAQGVNQRHILHRCAHACEHA